MPTLQETHEGLLKVPEDGEGGLAGGNVECAQILIGHEMHHIQREIGKHDEKNQNVVLLHHPLD